MSLEMSRRPIGDEDCGEFMMPAPSAPLMHGTGCHARYGAGYAPGYQSQYGNVFQSQYGSGFQPQQQQHLGMGMGAGVGTGMGNVWGRSMQPMQTGTGGGLLSNDNVLAFASGIQVDDGSEDSFKSNPTSNAPFNREAAVRAAVSSTMQRASER